eukprot:TRINITY_DN2666_c2_g1_i1.p1 TRINITY_DN2666_c2_g1~~TRINITY_DN2666_c2_g1_i1.p1  ORF type:complete len:222 (+),score=55.40 TRINITY_DN2666_c2_g1_i1:57-668(+)
MDLNCCQKSVCVTAGITGAYIVGYSAFDKKEKRLSLETLKTKFAFTDVSFSLKQINKVLGLVSLTTIGVSLAPENQLNKDCDKGLLKMGVAYGLLHAILSSTLFYKNNPLNMINGRGKNYPLEVPALIVGSTGMGILTSKAVTGGIAKDDLTYAGLALAILHFYLIETPTGLPQDLPISPFGYTAFVSSLYAFGSFVFRKVSQ